MKLCKCPWHSHFKDQILTQFMPGTFAGSRGVYGAVSMGQGKAVGRTLLSLPPAPVVRGLVQRYLRNCAQCRFPVFHRIFQANKLAITPMARSHLSVWVALPSPGGRASGGHQASGVPREASGARRTGGRRRASGARRASATEALTVPSDAEDEVAPQEAPGGAGGAAEGPRTAPSAAAGGQRAPSVGAEGPPGGAGEASAPQVIILLSSWCCRVVAGQG